MAVTNLTIGSAGAINYTVVTDTSADWPSVANSTYFYDKADKLVRFKDSTGTVRELFPSSGVTVGTTAVTSGTDGRVFFQAGGVIQQDGAFNWDNTNKRLGIGSTPSTSRLNVLSTNNTDADMQIRIGSTDGTTRFYTIGRESANGQLAFRWGGEAGALGAQFYFPVTTFNTITSSSSDQGTARLRVSNTGGGRTFALIAGVHNSSQSNFSLYDETAGITRFILDGSGNLGLGTGTTAPGARLDVRAQGALSTDIAFRVRNSADSANIFTIQGDGNISLSNPSTLGSETKIFGFGNTTDTILKYGNSVYGNVALGPNATYTIINSYGNVVLGAGASSVNGSGCVAIGNNVIASANGTITIGYTSKCFGASGIKIGNHQGASQFGGSNSIHLGSTTSGNDVGPDNVFMTYFNNQLSSTLTRSNGSFGLLGQQAYILGNGTGANGLTTFMGNGGNTLVIANHPNVPSTNIANAGQIYVESGALRYRDSAGTITNVGGSVQSVASAATVTPVYTNKFVKVTAQAVALTLANPTGTWDEGQDLMIRIKDNGLGAQTITWDTNYRAIGVTLPTTTVISKTTYVGVIYNLTDGKWDVIGVTTQA